MSESMGMTDKHYDTLVRFMLNSLQDAVNEHDAEKHQAKLQQIIQVLQKTLES